MRVIVCVHLCVFGMCSFTCANSGLFSSPPMRSYSLSAWTLRFAPLFPIFQLLPVFQSPSQKVFSHIYINRAVRICARNYTHSFHRLQCFYTNNNIPVHVIEEIRPCPLIEASQVPPTNHISQSSSHRNEVNA